MNENDSILIDIHLNYFSRVQLTISLVPTRRQANIWNKEFLAYMYASLGLYKLKNLPVMK